MAFVVNGIGTWHYGKRRIHRYKGPCSFCNRVVELESYDTTLYFVVVFIPVLPLSHKRILEACPVCQKHRYLSLKKWEESKAADIAAILEKLRQNPDDRDTIQAALGMAVSYQDETLFDKLADSLATHRLEDAAIQAQLGSAYAYFSRRDEAAAAFRASLAAEDNVEVRQQLAVTLLKQGRPEEAAPYLRHILDNKIADEAGLIYLLVEGYQAQGMHQEALELMDQRDAVFPELAIDPDIVKQRQLSEKHQHSGKKIASAYLSDSGQTGYREGGWTSRLPLVIAPLVIVAVLGLYLGSAIWIGKARKVYLVNGWDKPYTVSVNGTEHTLQPGAAAPVRLPEGEVTVEFRGQVALDPVRCQVETPFFSRPFANHMFVINPDRLAIVIWQETEYTEAPGVNQAGPPPRFYTGEGMHAFDGIDYEFTPFPDSVQAKKGHTIKKTRVGLMPDLTSEDRLNIASLTLNEKRQVEYAQRLLALNPNDLIPLYWMLSRLKGQEALDFLGTRLNARPVLVEWHRAYQSTAEKVRPNEDLRPQYRKLVAETKEHPDALYLLARVTDDDPDEAERLLKQAATARPPSAYAFHSLGYHALDQGRFAEGVSWTEQAVLAAPDNLVVRQGHHMALRAAKKYPELLADLQKQPRRSLREKYAVLLEQLNVYAAQRDEPKARSTMQQIVVLVADPQDPAARTRAQQSVDYAYAVAQGDSAAFLKLTASMADVHPFEPAFLQGKLEEAAGLVDPEEDKPQIQHGLLYLAARKAKNTKLAEAQFKLLVAALAKSRPSQRQVGDMLAGRKPLNVDRLIRLPVEPEQKRVLLVVFAQRHPETAAKLLPLARGLDFTQDVTSMCLRKVME